MRFDFEMEDKIKASSCGASERKRKSSKKTEKERELEPLREAAKRIAVMLCEFSGERELFVSDGAPERRLDTKALKEFSSVLKEISAVVTELSGGTESSGAVHIEFSEDVLGMSE